MRVNYKKLLIKEFIWVRLHKSNLALYLCIYAFILKLTYVNWSLYDNVLEIIFIFL